MEATAALVLVGQPLGEGQREGRQRGLELLHSVLAPGGASADWSPAERAEYLAAARPHMTAAEQARPAPALPHPDGRVEPLRHLRPTWFRGSDLRVYRGCMQGS